MLVVAAVGGLAGCATSVFNPATNQPLSASTPPNMGAPSDFMRENSIVLSFSGGGLRAAAFAHGVLTALERAKTADGDLLDDVASISSVSGGSLTAAYYGVYGREGLARFRSEVLLPGFESDMRLSLFNPANLMRMLGGGLNAREDFGDGLDRRVFQGATFADIFRRQGPDIRIHATDLYHRVPFPFLPPLFEIHVQRSVPLQRRRGGCRIHGSARAFSRRSSSGRIPRAASLFPRSSPRFGARAERIAGVQRDRESP